MLAWMLYGVVVSALLGLAALAAERSAHIRKASTRWLWVTAILASLALPTVISSVSIQVPRMSGDVLGHAPEADATPLRALTSSAIAPSVWLDAAATHMPASPDLDTVVTRTWIAVSALLVLAVLINGLLLHRAKRGWTRAVVAGAEVYISQDIGPAVVGLLRPRIVLPQWTAEAPPETQGLIIAHERSHLEAGDARLLAIGLLLTVAMPWNLALWWQLRRLRFAIEVDCDARVLKGGDLVSHYGETLIMVGERHASHLAVVAGMSESRSFLEQRLRIMLSTKKKFAWASAGALTVLGFVLAASAAEVTPPNAAAVLIPVANGDVTLDAKTLDNYVGTYSVTGKWVNTIARDGSQLSIQMTNQPAIPLFASSKTSFYAKQVILGVTFVTDAQGRATALIRHQGIDMTMPRISAATAQQIVNRTIEHGRGQTPYPGSEAALRRFIGGAVTGKVDYSAMDPSVAEGVRQQRPVQTWVQGLGQIQSVTFVAVTPQGNDVFSVRQEHGLSRWTISLSPENKINAIFVAPGAG